MNEGRIASIRAAKGYTILPVKPGMQLEIHEKITDWNNTRVWRFKGLVIKVTKPNHADGTFTIRGKSAWMTIEKIYPLSFPNFDKLVLLDQFKVRRAKLYYIRDKVWKDAKMKSLLTNADKWVDLLQLAQEDLEKVVAQFEHDQKQFAWDDWDADATSESVESSEGASVEANEASDIDSSESIEPVSSDTEDTVEVANTTETEAESDTKPTAE